MKRKLLLVAFMLFVLFSASSATISYAAIVNPTGNVTKILYDNMTNAYDDAGINPNTYLRLCTNNLTDLSGKYVGYVYFAGNVSLQISSFIGGPLGNLLPILYINGSNCTTVDLDISSTKAYYPGIPGVVISNDMSIDSNDTFLQLNQSSAFLSGNYTIEKKDSTSTSTITIKSIKSNSGTAITTIKPAIVVGLLRKDNHQVLSSKIMMPNESAVLSNAGSKDTIVEINGILISKEEGAGGITTGLLGETFVLIQLCNITTEHSYISILPANVRAYASSSYCLDLHLESISANKNLSDVNVYITQLDSIPSNIPHFGSASDFVYGVFELSNEGINSGDVKNAAFNMRVLKSWLNNRHVSADSINLMKYDGSTWGIVDSTKTGQNDAYYYFNATSTGLSYYIIYGTKTDIWYVLGVIDKYYAGTSSFLEVLDAISVYYTQ